MGQHLGNPPGAGAPGELQVVVLDAVPRDRGVPDPGRPELGERTLDAQSAAGSLDLPEVGGDSSVQRCQHGLDAGGNEPVHTQERHHAGAGGQADDVCCRNHVELHQQIRKCDMRGRLVDHDAHRATHE